MNIGRLRDFFEYGPLVSAARIEEIKRNEIKRREMFARRAEKRRRALAEADSTITGFERIVLGVTPEQILRNRNRVRRELRESFDEDFSDEIAERAGIIAKRMVAKGSDDYGYDETFSKAYRAARRQVWRENKDDYTADFDIDDVVEVD